MTVFRLAALPRSGGKRFDRAQPECRVGLDGLPQETEMSRAEDDEHSVAGLNDVHEVRLNTDIALVPLRGEVRPGVAASRNEFNRMD